MQNSNDDLSGKQILVAMIVTVICFMVLLIPYPLPHHDVSEKEPYDAIIEPSDRGGEGPEKQPENIGKPRLAQELHPDLVPVCACETVGSPYLEPQHTYKDGTVITGHITPDDVGICQINTLPNVHGKTLARLGLDAYNREDNIKYANMLYEQQGLAPWSASKHCWEVALLKDKKISYGNK